MYAAAIKRTVQDMFNEVSQRNFFIANLRFRTSDRPERTLAPVLLHLAHKAPLLAALLLELALLHCYTVTVEEIHIKWVLLSKPKKPLSTHRAGGVPDEGEQ